MFGFVWKSKYINHQLHPLDIWWFSSSILQRKNKFFITNRMINSEISNVRRHYWDLIRHPSARQWFRLCVTAIESTTNRLINDDRMWIRINHISIVNSNWNIDGLSFDLLRVWCIIRSLINKWIHFIYFANCHKFDSLPPKQRRGL